MAGAGMADATTPFKPTVVNGVHQPVPELVQELEQLVTWAKAGKLRACAFATVCAEGSQPDGVIGSGFVVGPMTSYAMAAAIYDHLIPCYTQRKRS